MSSACTSAPGSVTEYVRTCKPRSIAIARSFVPYGSSALTAARVANAGSNNRALASKYASTEWW